MLDSNGNVLATSNGPEGNIGYPSTEPGKRHFRDMLLETSERLSEDEIDAIVNSL